MSKSKPAPKGKRKSKQSDPTPQDQIAATFMSCARCSFFLVGYKLLHNDFDEAVGKSGDGQLTLTWDDSVRRLVHKSYGNQIEMDVYYYHGSCKECHRSFVFEEGQTGEQPATLKFVLKNR